MALIQKTENLVVDVPDMKLNVGIWFRRGWGDLGRGLVLVLILEKGKEADEARARTKKT